MSDPQFHSTNWGWGKVEPITWECGRCARGQVSRTGVIYLALAGPGQREHLIAWVFFCSACGLPTFRRGDEQLPGKLPGKEIEGLPPELGALYQEARHSIAARAHTAAVLVLRVLLLHLAANNGMQVVKGTSFKDATKHIVSTGLVGTRAESRAESIRTLGNEANHELALVTEKEALELFDFMEHLLFDVYRAPSTPPAP